MKKLFLSLFFVVFYVSSVYAENMPKQVVIGHQLTLNTQTLAIAKGYFEQEFQKIGIAVKYANFDNGRDMNNAFAARSIDFGALGIVPFVLASVGGLDNRIFTIHAVLLESEGLAVRKGRFKSVGDLRGKTIATPFGTTAHYALLHALRLHGLDTKDAKIVDMTPEAMLPAWERGDIDAAYIWEVVLSGLKDSELLYSSAQLAENGILIADVGSVRAAFAQQYPAAVAAYQRALKLAFDDYKNNQQDAAKALAKFFGLNESLMTFLISPQKSRWIATEEQHLPQYLGDSSSNKGFGENLEQVAIYLKEQKLLRKVPDRRFFENLIDNTHTSDK